MVLHVSHMGFQVLLSVEFLDDVLRGWGSWGLSGVVGDFVGDMLCFGPVVATSEGQVAGEKVWNPAGL